MGGRQVGAGRRALEDARTAAPKRPRLPRARRTRASPRRPRPRPGSHRSTAAWPPGEWRGWPDWRGRRRRRRPGSRRPSPDSDPRRSGARASPRPRPACRWREGVGPSWAFFGRTIGPSAAAALRKKPPSLPSWKSRPAARDPGAGVIEIAGHCRSAGTAPRPRGSSGRSRRGTPSAGGDPRASCGTAGRPRSCGAGPTRRRRSASPSQSGRPSWPDAWARAAIIRPFQSASTLSSRPGRIRSSRAARRVCAAPRQDDRPRHRAGRPGSCSRLRTLCPSQLPASVTP